MAVTFRFQGPTGDLNSSSHLLSQGELLKFDLQVAWPRNFSTAAPISSTVWHNGGEQLPLGKGVNYCAFFLGLPLSFSFLPLSAAAFAFRERGGVGGRAVRPPNLVCRLFCCGEGGGEGESAADFLCGEGDWAGGRTGSVSSSLPPIVSFFGTSASRIEIWEM